MELAEEIEKLIDFVDEDGRSVHLPMEFVRHYMRRDDGVLPTVVAIATLPIILADGGVLAYEDDIDVERGIDFMIPKEVMALMPKLEECTDEAVKKAMEFLTDDWLCDVKTSYAGKATIIAAGLTVIERSLLPDRPTFFVTAGRRGSGKTTTITMMIKAITGIWPAAAAWTENEEERRKALLSYFLHGVSYILWDNIKRGAQISCPHIERSCTAAYYSDRRLGVSETVATAASSIHFFTGNNIGASGDLASRSLTIRLDADRADPENRPFKHPDPVGWTDDNRVEILRAFYTILLGNPKLKEKRDAQMKTRFKMWYRLVGSAVEHAASLTDKGKADKVDFQALFKAQDEDDEDDASLAEVLSAMKAQWRDGKFKASDLCTIINADHHPVNLPSSTDVALRDLCRAHFFETYKDYEKVIANAVGKKLKQHVGEAVLSGSETLILKTEPDTSSGSKGSAFYWVATVTGQASEG